ncbi:unnamed protein product [Paramecium sonneborni]|uniref:Uncharacterized protein n=1 Tax=Paramecium sonneborni TaxID=65129 RepID=A0A8S1RVN4_9CILI|nr:unnamed protein product [Paramecium sonneborni]
MVIVNQLKVQNCKAKECTNASTSLSTDVNCKAYQSRCITIGKGCFQVVHLILMYFANSIKQVVKQMVGLSISLNILQRIQRSFNLVFCIYWIVVKQLQKLLVYQKFLMKSLIQQQSCERKNSCSWQPIYTSNKSCSEFKKKAICLANLARVQKLDKYDNQKFCWLKQVNYHNIQLDMNGVNFLELSQHAKAIQLIEQRIDNK